MKNLIEKYLNGETTLQEEAELKAYFNSGQVDDSLKEYEPLFQFFEQEKQLELSADFDEKLFERINAETNIVDDLVEKFFAGDTSIEEEEELKTYFNSGQIDKKHQSYLPLFEYFKKGREIELSSDFEEKLFEKINAETTAMDDLIEQYFKAETSLEDEEKIKAYFNSGQIDKKHQSFQPLFQYFKKEQKVEVSSDFDEKLFEKINRKGAKVIQIRNFRRRMLRVAAVAAVLFAAILYFNKPIQTPPPVVNWTEYEISDEQLAYEETVKALKLLSSKLNKGKKKTVQEVSKTEPITKYLN